MAFHNHLSHEMALQHFTEQHLGENTAVLRSIIPEQLGQTSSDGTGGAGKEQKDIQRLMIETGGKPKQQQPPPGQQHHLGGGGGGGGPTWLSNAILRQQNQYVDGSFLHLQTNSDSPTSAASNQWLPRPILQRNASDVGGGDDVPVSSDSMIAAAMSHNSADLNANNDNRNSGNNQNPGDNSGGAELAESEAGGGGDGVGSWQNAKYKADILAHPLYEQLLSAHVACLRIATPVDQLPRIDAQLAQSQHVVAKYSVLGHGNQQLVSDDKELDQFMIRCAIESGGKKLEIPATSLVGTLAYRCKGFNAKAVRCNSFCHDCDLPSWFRNSNGSMEPRLSRKEGDKVVQKMKLGNREQSLNKLNA